MLDRDFWELASFVITALGLPLAIGIFLYEQRKERRNEEYEAYQLLSNAYNDFLKVVVENSDLRLGTSQATPDLNADQTERLRVILDMLIALFERAYLTAWAPRMSEEQRRRWNSWEDFMRDWIRRDDFYFRLPELLRGEDPEFVAYLRKLAEEERGIKLPA
jgi:hypothetical protein